MSVRVVKLIGEGADRLMKAGCMNPGVDARELFMFLKGIRRTRLFMMLNEDVDDETATQYLELIERRAAREPLQYITGVQEFMGIRLSVNRDVLIPRPETELMVEQAIKVILSGTLKMEPFIEEAEFFEAIEPRKNWKVLDLCCGSGAIGIAVAKRCRDVKVTACDISSEAVSVAMKNASSAHVNIKFRTGDLFEPVKRKKFDMIISNPPYIKSYMIPALQEEVRDFEPVSALDGGGDGLSFYRRIADEAPSHLNPGGVLMMETGHDQGDEVLRLLNQNDAFERCVKVRDYNNFDRIAVAVKK